jgi:hypothetical protein
VESSEQPELCAGHSEGDQQSQRRTSNETLQGMPRSLRHIGARSKRMTSLKISLYFHMYVFSTRRWKVASPSQIETCPALQHALKWIARFARFRCLCQLDKDGHVRKA